MSTVGELRAAVKFTPTGERVAVAAARADGEVPVSVASSRVEENVLAVRRPAAELTRALDR